MKLPPNAGQRLILPGLVAVALIVAGVVAAMAANGMITKARAEWSAAKSEREQAQAKLARATDEERDIREKLVDYRKLLDRGMIGEEKRLDWIDRIGAIKAARKLFDVKYSIEPQRTVDYPGVGGKGNVEFLASTMKLNMLLLHEEDLLRFIGDLQEGLSAYVIVRTCSIDRALSAPTERGLATQLRANCEIDLVTIRDRQVKKI